MEIFPHNLPDDHHGLTPRLVSDETMRLAWHRLGVSWKRAQHWITSPDPA
jgi:hypothetical protein